MSENCNLTTLDGASVLYLDRVEASWPLRLTMAVGVHVPLHATASGKLFLAFMPATRRDLLIEQLQLTKMTATTLVCVATLRRECEAIAMQGYSLDREEFIDGLVAAAVPVRDATGEVRAAIAVHAPTARLSIDRAIGRLPALRAAAERMARLL